MPVATVDEHHDPGASEQQVRRSTQVALRSRVDPVPVPYYVHQAAHRQLRLRVPASIALHGLPGGSWRHTARTWCETTRAAFPPDRVADAPVAEPLTCATIATGPPGGPGPQRNGINQPLSRKVERPFSAAPSFCSRLSSRGYTHESASAGP